MSNFLSFHIFFKIIKKWDLFQERQNKRKTLCIPQFGLYYFIKKEHFCLLSVWPNEIGNTSLSFKNTEQTETRLSVTRLPKSSHFLENILANNFGVFSTFWLMLYHTLALFHA